MLRPMPRSRPPAAEPPTAVAGTSTSTSTSDRYARILAVVRRIPAGRVATYGQIAALAGFPRQARLAGYALHHAGDARLPWHRVINAQGKCSFPADSENYRRQKQRLEAEGVPLLGGRVDLQRYGWKARSDSPLLD